LIHPGRKDRANFCANSEVDEDKGGVIDDQEEEREEEEEEICDKINKYE
jgi:hypothetical protein